MGGGAVTPVLPAAPSSRRQAHSMSHPTFPAGHIKALGSFASQTTPPPYFKRPALESASQKRMKGTIQNKNSLKAGIRGAAGPGCGVTVVIEVQPSRARAGSARTVSAHRPLSKVTQG